jgi:hypothetical protein
MILRKLVFLQDKKQASKIILLCKNNGAGFVFRHDSSTTALLQNSG